MGPSVVCVDEVSNRLGLGEVSLAVQEGARLRYRAEFSAHPYANISFYDAERENILFHLSLRHDESRAVCNRRDGETWRREIGRAVQLPAAGVTVDILFTPPVVTVKLDGRQVFRFGKGLRRPFPQTGRIAYVDLQGGITPGGVDIDDLARVPDNRLYLNSRLELRAHLRNLPPETELHMQVSETKEALPVIVQPAGDGLELRALLPGRVWDTVPADMPLEIAVMHADGRAACPALSLDRAALAQAEAEFEGEDALFLACDITDEDEVAEVFDRVADTLGPLAALVNSAGIARDLPAMETSAELFRQILDVNLVGSFIASKAAVEAIKNAGGKLTATSEVKEKTAVLKKKKAAQAEEPAADKGDDVGTDKE